MTPRRWLLVVAALALGLVLGLALSDPGPREPDGATPAAPPRPLAAAAPDAALPLPPAPPARGPAATLATFQEGFCDPEGDEVDRPHRLLLTRLVAEVERGAAGRLAPEEAALLRRALGPPARQGPRPVEDAERLAARRPDSPWPWVALGLLHGARGEAGPEVAAFRRARERGRHDATLGLAVALATRNEPDLDDALDGLGDLLAEAPEPAVARLRARLEVQRDLHRGYARRTLQGVTLLWPPAVLGTEQASGVLLAIDRALDDAARLTASPRRGSLTAVVYPGRSELLAVSCAPTWAGGLYDGTLRLVASSRDALGVEPQALLHETLHAQLTPLAPTAPSWFHEGLAQSFAREDARARPQWTAMVREGVWIPFTSLDGSFSGVPASDVTLAYRQAMAMVELLRDTCGPGALATALAAFQRRATTAAALAEACHRPEVTGPELLAYLSGRLAP